MRRTTKLPTVDEKKAKEPCDWLLTDVGNDSEEKLTIIREDLADLCDKYGWYFNDATKPKVPPVPVSPPGTSKAAGKRRR